MVKSLYTLMLLRGVLPFRLVLQKSGVGALILAGKQTKSGFDEAFSTFCFLGVNDVETSMPCCQYIREMIHHKTAPKR